MAVSAGKDFDEVIHAINSRGSDDITLTAAMNVVKRIREQEFKDGLIAFNTLRVVDRIVDKVRGFEDTSGPVAVSSLLFSSNTEGNAMAVIRSQKLFEDFYRYTRATSNVNHNSAQYETQLLDSYIQKYFDRTGGTFKRYKPSMKSTERPVVALPKSVCVDLYRTMGDKWVDYYMDYGKEAEAYIYAHKMMVFGVFTCLRHSDLLSLCVEDFQDNGENMWLVKHSKKTKHVQKTIMPPKLADLVRQARANGEHYLLSIGGRRIADPARVIYAHKTAAHYMRMILRAYEECGVIYKFTSRESDNTFTVKNKNLVDIFRVHDLRASGITMHLSNGMSERNVCNISGHKPGSAAFNRYVAYVKDFHESELVDSFGKLGII